MVKTHRIEILCTANEHERIRNNAQAKGFSTVSAFLRDFALRSPITSEERITEIHNAIVRSKLGIERIADSLLSKYCPNSLYMQYPTKTEYAIPLRQEYEHQPKQNPLYKPDPLNEPEPQDAYDFQDPDY